MSHLLLLPRETLRKWKGCSGWPNRSLGMKRGLTSGNVCSAARLLVVLLLVLEGPGTRGCLFASCFAWWTPLTWHSVPKLSPQHDFSALPVPWLRRGGPVWWHRSCFVFSKRDLANLPSGEEHGRGIHQRGHWEDRRKPAKTAQ